MKLSGLEYAIYAVDLIGRGYGLYKRLGWHGISKSSVAKINSLGMIFRSFFSRLAPAKRLLSHKLYKALSRAWFRDSRHKGLLTKATAVPYGGCSETLLILYVRFHTIRFMDYSDLLVVA
jgi:hypothetical protein